MLPKTRVFDGFGGPRLEVILLSEAFLGIFTSLEMDDVSSGVEEGLTRIWEFGMGHPK